MFRPTQGPSLGSTSSMETYILHGIYAGRCWDLIIYFFYFTQYAEKTVGCEAAEVCRYRKLVGSAPWLWCHALLVAAIVSGVSLWKRYRRCVRGLVYLWPVSRMGCNIVVLTCGRQWCPHWCLGCQCLIDIDIFVNCNWVVTRWQYTFTHKQYIEQYETNNTYKNTTSWLVIRY